MMHRPAAGSSLIFCVSPFAALSLKTVHLPEMAGQAPLRPDPDAFPVEVCPRSAATIACLRTRKLNGSGKPKLTRADGLRIRDVCARADEKELTPVHDARSAGSGPPQLWRNPLVAARGSRVHARHRRFGAGATPRIRPAP